MWSARERAKNMIDKKQEHTAKRHRDIRGHKKNIRKGSKSKETNSYQYRVQGIRERTRRLRNESTGDKHERNI